MKRVNRRSHLRKTKSGKVVPVKDHTMKKDSMSELEKLGLYKPFKPVPKKVTVSQWLELMEEGEKSKIQIGDKKYEVKRVD